ncbi:MAG TPA: LON peptidase substrate-binding domain-containing protein [Burkholderiales bacterium]|nr:LON peptidase substrate-binding domain-containing protein [Burkholderiales bacterium]
MNGAATRPLPIFPLETVLFPGALLPLKIFEQRYLDMTKACIRDGTPFGVCRIREGREVGAPAVPEPVGCSAHIAHWEMPHPGMFLLQARGEKAFRILRHAVQPGDLIGADVEFLEDHPGTADPQAMALCRRLLEQVAVKLGSDYFPAPHAFDDARWVGYRLAEVLPLDTLRKQALLEERDDGARLRRLHDYLREAG